MIYYSESLYMYVNYYILFFNLLEDIIPYSLFSSFIKCR